MGNKKKRIQEKNPKSTNNNGKNILNTQVKGEDYNKRHGKIIFKNVNHHSKCKIEKWQGKELTSLIECFKKIESLTWNEIFENEGLNWERNKNIAIPLPENFPNDAKLCSMRVSKKMRIYGYRSEEYFCIIWFDKNHEVCPENKVKKYSA